MMYRRVPGMLRHLQRRRLAAGGTPPHGPALPTWPRDNSSLLLVLTTVAGGAFLAGAKIYQLQQRLDSELEVKREQLARMEAVKREQLARLEAALKSEKETRAAEVRAAKAETQAAREASFLRYTFTDDYQPWRKKVEDAQQAHSGSGE